ncbi:MAG: hypothetical protein ACRBN8_10005 [Nannocystales bacterium]
MPASKEHSRIGRFTAVGAAFGALTVCLGGAMLWSTSHAPGVGTAGGVLAMLVVGAAIGWLGTERIVAVAQDVEEVSE